MAFVSKSMAASPALLSLVMALVLVQASSSTKAHQLILPPTPAPTTPAPTPAPSESLCPAGFANLSSFQEAKLELFKLHIILILQSNGSIIGGTTTEKPAGAIDTTTLASILPGITLCLCSSVGTDDLVHVDVDDLSSSTYLGAITCTKISV
ncbi:hypothetical protein BDA96_10G277400 [Sorghum bicolor]|jgi:hypothetical protein|uniref:Hydrophobic seed protein domain-containing protein n=2 Tax=Sorghum bicolor TaxID=4558 RepID=A0A921Q7N6_SORBI|nr:hypothetical protein BDA96_10G277400 [Sorghum bicolor]OQU76801.1 hypothetical protein SORBI_3010G213301 [Sorghum bicolor]